MENGETEQNRNISRNKVLKEKRNRNNNWTDAEVQALMKAWFDHHKDFKSTRRGCSKKLLYDKISLDICRHGFQRTAAEAQTKLQNLLKLFRKEKEHMKQTGEKRSNWRYYDLVKHIVDADHQEIGNSMHGYLSSDPDSGDVGTDAGSTSTHIIQMPNYEGSDSDNPSIFNCLVEFKDTPDQEEDIIFQSSPQKEKQENIEEVLGAFLLEFKRSNAQSEKNDQEIVGLLKENNELCKQQIELLSLHLNK